MMEKVQALNSEYRRLMIVIRLFKHVKIPSIVLILVFCNIQRTEAGNQNINSRYPSDICLNSEQHRQKELLGRHHRIHHHRLAYFSNLLSASSRILSIRAGDDDLKNDDYERVDLDAFQKQVQGLVTKYRLDVQETLNNLQQDIVAKETLKNKIKKEKKKDNKTIRNLTNDMTKNKLNSTSSNSSIPGNNLDWEYETSLINKTDSIDPAEDDQLINVAVHKVNEVIKSNVELTSVHITPKFEDTSTDTKNTANVLSFENLRQKFLRTKAIIIDSELDWEYEISDDENAKNTNMMQLPFFRKKNNNNKIDNTYLSTPVDNDTVSEDAIMTSPDNGPTLDFVVGDSDEDDDDVMAKLSDEMTNSDNVEIKKSEDPSEKSEFFLFKGWNRARKLNVEEIENETLPINNATNELDEEKEQLDESQNTTVKKLSRKEKKKNIFGMIKMNEVKSLTDDEFVHDSNSNSALSVPISLNEKQVKRKKKRRKKVVDTTTDDFSSSKVLVDNSSQSNVLLDAKQSINALLLAKRTKYLFKLVLYTILYLVLNISVQILLKVLTKK